MSNQDYKVENEELWQRVVDLEKTNNELVIHNMQLSQKMDAYYDVRRRIYIKNCWRVIPSFCVMPICAVMMSCWL